MNKGHCIGLLGGVGVGAAAHYYSSLAAAHTARSLILDLVMVHADMNRTMTALEANDPDSLAVYFNSLIQRMAAAGAEIAVIPSVTSHFPLDQLRPISSIPLIDIFAPLKRELAARNIKRVAAFGTKFVQRSNLYGRVPELEIVPSTPDESEFIHSTYMDIAWRGRGTSAEHAALTTLAQELIRREQLDAVLFAGTDLSFVFNSSNTDFPAIDMAALHIAAIVEQTATPS
jgi:aspartate racemase